MENNDNKRPINNEQFNSDAAARSTGYHCNGRSTATMLIDPSPIAIATDNDNDNSIVTSSVLSISTSATASSSSSGGCFGNNTSNGGGPEDNGLVGCNLLGGISKNRKTSSRRRLSSSGNCNGGMHHINSGGTKKNNVDYDNILARELNALSFEERNKVYEEVHGVAKLPNETPEFMKSCLDSLKEEIAKLSRSKRRVLDKAFFLKPTLATDTKFMTMFLRADCFDVQKAANRMAKYFTHKLQLWGLDKLVKDITLDDMDTDDLQCMQTGSVHILREKDRSGRTVLFVAQNQFRYKDWKNQTRYLWYQVMAALEDEETQIRGLVDIIYNIGMDHYGHASLLTQGAYILNDLPFRLVGVHFCYSDSRLKAAASLTQMVLAQQSRLRFRGHIGSDIEAKYALRSFGIPVNAIPIADNGRLLPEMNQSYIQERKLIELRRKQQKLHGTQQQQPTGFDGSRGANCMTTATTNKSFRVFDYPSLNDVLLGRGRPFQEFYGNQQLLYLVEEQRSKYHLLTDKFEKTCITIGIVDKIKSDLGGRFIQRTKEGWKEVDDVVAREKVSHTFRTKTNKVMIQPPIPMKMEVVGSSSTNGYGSQNKRIRLHEGRTNMDDDETFYKNWG